MDLVEEDISQLPKNSFRLDEIEKSWMHYLDKIKNTSIPVYNALHLYEIQVKDNFEILFLFNSNSSIQEFDNVKTEWIQQLKEKIQNFHLMVSTETKHFEKENYVLTKEEIYKKMVEINPLVDELRKSLNLDIFG